MLGQRLAQERQRGPAAGAIDGSLMLAAVLVVGAPVDQRGRLRGSGERFEGLGLAGSGGLLGLIRR